MTYRDWLQQKNTTSVMLSSQRSISTSASNEGEILRLSPQDDITTQPHPGTGTDD
jgi:hypothetical protein